MKNLEFVNRAQFELDTHDLQYLVIALIHRLCESGLDEEEKERYAVLENLFSDLNKMTCKRNNWTLDFFVSESDGEV